MFFTANIEHKGILINCPHCRFSSRYDIGFIEDAIRATSPIVCVACSKRFTILTMRQTRVVEQRDETDGELAGKAPKELRTED